jgi:hypothetical protein
MISMNLPRYDSDNAIRSPDNTPMATSPPTHWGAAANGYQKRNRGLETHLHLESLVHFFFFY